MLQVNLRNNQLCGIDYWGSGTYTDEGIKAIADALRVSNSLNSIDVGFNKIDQPAALELLAAMKGRDMVSIGMADCNLGVEGAKVVADMAAVMGSLTSINLYYNKLGPEGAKALVEGGAFRGSLTAAELRFNQLDDAAKQMLRDSVKDRAGFELQL